MFTVFPFRSEKTSFCSILPQYLFSVSQLRTLVLSHGKIKVLEKNVVTPMAVMCCVTVFHLIILIFHKQRGTPTRFFSRDSPLIADAVDRHCLNHFKIQKGRIAVILRLLFSYFYALFRIPPHPCIACKSDQCRATPGSIRFIGFGKSSLSRNIHDGSGLPISCGCSFHPHTQTN